MPLLAWTSIYRTFLRPDLRFDLRQHAYLIDLYNTTAQYVVVRKAAQVGISELLVSYVLHALEQRKLDVLYVMPTDATVSDFSSTRFSMAIEASPRLQAIIAESGVPTIVGRRMQQRDLVRLKRIRDNLLYLRGGYVSATGRAPQLKSVPVHIAVMDEYDEIDPRAPAMIEKRLGHSSIAEQRLVSTPTYTGVGIDAEWEKTTQHQWMLRCEHCGRWQDITIQDVVLEWDDLERPVRWYEQDGVPYVACRHCRKKLNRLAMGRWVPTYPDRVALGYHISKLFVASSDLTDILKNLGKVNEEDRKQAYNQDLGLPYAPRGTKLTAAVLDGVRREYGMLAASAHSTYMGIDVGLQLHVVIRHSENGQLVWAGTVTHFEDLPALVRRYRVRRCVIDALPETRKAREFQGKLSPGVVWLAYYNAAGSKHDEMSVWNEKEYVVSVDRTRSIDEVVARITTGEYTLPASARDIPEYYDHLLNIVRVTKKSPDGNVVAVWMKTGPDHYAHAENYCLVASERKQVSSPVVQGVARRKLP